MYHPASPFCYYSGVPDLRYPRNWPASVHTKATHLMLSRDKSELIIAITFWGGKLLGTSAGFFAVVVRSTQTTGQKGRIQFCLKSAQVREVVGKIGRHLITQQHTYVQWVTTTRYNMLLHYNRGSIYLRNTWQHIEKEWLSSTCLKIQEIGRNTHTQLQTDKMGNSYRTTQRRNDRRLRNLRNEPPGVGLALLTRKTPKTTQSFGTDY